MLIAPLHNLCHHVQREQHHACNLHHSQIFLMCVVYMWLLNTLLQMCTDGVGCKRRVCFFAHAEGELRKPEEDPVWLQQQMQAEMAAGEAQAGREKGREGGRAVYVCAVLHCATDTRLARHTKQGSLTQASPIDAA